MDEKLIENAVAFLTDPSVAHSPAPTKIEFLKAKGLNDSEIEQALQKAQEPSSSAVPVTNSSTQPVHLVANPEQSYYNAPPPVPPRSWKDYFIMATATAGVSYAMYHVISRYLIPAIMPPSQREIDNDKRAVDEEFQKIDSLLQQLLKEQADTKTATDAKLKEVDVAVVRVTEFLNKYAQDKTRVEDDLRLLKLEIGRVSDLIEKNMASQLSKIKQELGEIGDEMKSLKQMLKTRGTMNGVEPRKIAPASSLPSVADIIKRRGGPKADESAPVKDITTETKHDSAGIPSWQMAAAQGDNSQKLTSSTTVGGVTAAGIPAWQMAHKANEEKQDSPSNLNSDIVDQNIAKVGPPAWQLNTSSKASRIDEKEQNEQKEQKD